jgi:hypothetical protein
MYDALNHGALEPESLRRRWRRCRCPGPGRADRARGRCQPLAALGRSNHLRPAVLPRLRPRGGVRPNRSRAGCTPSSPPSSRAGRRGARYSTRSASTETTAEPTASEESNSDAERGADATTGAPENSPSSDAGNLDATSPVTPRPPGPPVAATRRARAAVRAARAPSAPRRDDLLATVRRPPVWSVVHAGSSCVQFGG